MFEFIKTDEGIDLSFNNKIYKPYEFSIVNNEIWIFISGYEYNEIYKPEEKKNWDCLIWHKTGVFIK